MKVARLAIDRDFLDDYAKLPKTVQAGVKSAIDKFAEHVHAGLHLEKLSAAKDDRIRTIRRSGRRSSKRLRAPMPASSRT